MPYPNITGNRWNMLAKDRDWKDAPSSGTVEEVEPGRWRATADDVEGEAFGPTANDAIWTLTNVRAT